MCETNLISSHEQQASMLDSISNSRWRPLNTTGEEASLVNSIKKVALTTEAQTWKWNRWRQRIWLDVMEDPSPPVLVMKWFSVALLGLAIYHSHLDDPYQNYFLVAGLGFAAIVAHVSSQSLMSGLQTYLPICVMLALCWSAVVHRVGRAMSRYRSRQKRSKGGQWEVEYEPLAMIYKPKGDL